MNRAEMLGSFFLQKGSIMNEGKKFELRCKGCGRLLGNVAGDSDIVCPRCGGLNKFSYGSGLVKFFSKNLRSRKTSAGVTYS